MQRRTFVTAAVAATLAACRAQEPRLLQAVADLSAVQLTGLDGSAVTLGHWHGRVLVLNVWASWCAPCRAEMASLQALSERLDPARAAVIGLSVDDDPNLVHEYLRRARLRFPIFLQSDAGSAQRELGVRALPETLVLSSDGRLAGREAGPRDWNENALLARWQLPLLALGGRGDADG